MTNIGLKALEEKIKDNLPNVKQLSLDFSGYAFCKNSNFHPFIRCYGITEGGLNSLRQALAFVPQFNLYC